MQQHIRNEKFKCSPIAGAVGQLFVSHDRNKQANIFCIIGSQGSQQMQGDEVDEEDGKECKTARHMLVKVARFKFGCALRWKHLKLTIFLVRSSFLYLTILCAHSLYLK